MGFMDDYEPVEERLRQFWEEHPHGRIVTDLVHHAEGDYIFKASVFVAEHHYLGTANGEPLYQDKEPDATGWAHDSVATLPNNMKASALEVCETSAIGRALANLGYAPKGQRPSREEMSKSSGEPSTQPAKGAPPPSSSVPAEGQSPDPSKYQGTPTQPSGGEAQRDTGAPTHGEGTSPETVQESGLNSSVKEVAVTPAPGAVTEIGANGAKALAAAIGGQKAAFDLARDQWPDTTNLKKLTMAQASELLEIAGKSA